MENKFTYLIVILVLLLIFLSNNSFSQQLTTPVNIHLPIMLKSIEYDRNIVNRDNDVVRIGIIYQENYRVSLNTKNQVLIYITDNNLQKLVKFSLEFITINLNELSTLREFLQNQNLDYAYITPLRAININKLAQILRDKKILALTGVVDYINYKIPFTVDVVGDNPKIIIDLNNSRLSGADFSTNILKLAKIIDSNGN